MHLHILKVPACYVTKKKEKKKRKREGEEEEEEEERREKLFVYLSMATLFLDIFATYFVPNAPKAAGRSFCIMDENRGERKRRGERRGEEGRRKRREEKGRRERGGEGRREREERSLTLDLARPQVQVPLFCMKE